MCIPPSSPGILTQNATRALFLPSAVQRNPALRQQLKCRIEQCSFRAAELCQSRQSPESAAVVQPQDPTCSSSFTTALGPSALPEKSAALDYCPCDSTSKERSVVNPRSASTSGGDHDKDGLKNRLWRETELCRRA